MENQNKTFFYYEEKQVEWNKKPETRRVTVAGVINGSTLVIGKAECSVRDNFTKKKGRAIAIGRALKKPVKEIGIDSDLKGVGKLFHDIAKKII